MADVETFHLCSKVWSELGVNSKHLEENRSGRWVKVSARRPSLVMSFPAHPSTVVPLDALVATRGDEEEELETGSARVLRGNLLYSPRAVPDVEAIGGGRAWLLIHAAQGL